LREDEKNHGQPDDQAAQRAAAHAGDEQPDENEQHHGGAGLVLVREHAAPLAGMLRLKKVGGLMHRKLRQ
jgi:hypothetical protein